MKTAGFTFIRNALLNDYPVVEAVRSILPLCDYIVVAVGQSDDGTLELVRSIGDPKIHILETVWDDNLREGGRVLAEETNKAFDAIPPEYAWCFYIQADECVHEADLPAIRAGMERWLHDPQTEGLLFNYRHFYGSYDYIGASRRWYRREVRIIRNDKTIRSYKDAQGFRSAGGVKLRVRQIDACIYHYGWVKHPAAQQRKQLNFNRLWHSDEKVHAMVGDSPVYTYDGTEALERFAGAHPAVMYPRINAVNWHFEGDPALSRRTCKEWLSQLFERHTGWRPGEYRNYVLLK
ncbi:MAG: glycosyltransferase family 2 protein [Saprospirales bacterium]|nr:glycosyltransferase family 2 protein [Saprospirales bacterium]MBK8922523.1 glycosyltransferase family 2 protein [Saprospirales bacterium]